MYASIYFTGDKTTSVIYEKNIRWPHNTPSSSSGNLVKPGVNDVEVFWNDRYVTGKILYKSTNKTYSERLHVGEDGELDPPIKKQMLRKEASNLSKKINSQIEKKNSKEARNSTKKQFNKLPCFLDIPDKTLRKMAGEVFKPNGKHFYCQWLLCVTNAVL
ncbi:hypothetical protein PV327_010105 [Microctonus hyperodae]|uniref:Uncharacterized protein n=1 Tax=Microctonus hyperodae TaxID=165561 RepID=A0AA39FRU0_MICHY|nr:hypothetical protein PV327_010105 [Microctonus hyperodae]